MFRVLAVLCGAVLVSTACSSTDDSPGSTPKSTPTPTKGVAATSVLDKITPQQICDFVDNASIKNAVGEAPEGANSRRSGKAPITTTFTCNYRMGVPAVTTEVATTEVDKSDKQVLDQEFIDYSSGDNAVIEYDAVPDLGVLAGYGLNATLASVDLNGHKLGVVFRAGTERLSMTVLVSGDATLDKVKPLAEEFMKNFAAAVGS